jgi:hypothetical protein
MITREMLEQRPLSFSSLKEFAKSPKHYMDYISRPKTPPTDAMKLGSAVHCMILTPELFNDQFSVAPEINKRTNAGKEEWALFASQNEGKDILSNDDYEHARRLSDGVLANPYVRNLLNHCYAFEEEWGAEINDLPFKGFYDAVADDYVIEIKTISDGNPKSVMSDFYKRKYHMQAALYSTASLGKDVYYIVVETSAPYINYVALADKSYIEKGAQDFGYYSRKFMNCMYSNKWNEGYDFYHEDGVIIKLPWDVNN